MCARIYLLSFLFIAFQVQAQGFGEYDTKVEVPEPLFVDLVRGLGSVKGEWEVNSLFYHSQGDFNQMNWAPEVEWAFSDGTAIEFELPIQGSTLKTYKSAFQKRLGSNGRSPTLQGIQVILESDTDFRHGEGTFFYILAHRFNHQISSMTLLGPKVQFDGSQNLQVSINQSLFYNHSEEIDFGLEINYLSSALGERSAQVVPQLHLALERGYKIQAGFGGEDVQGAWSPLAVFRLIREFNSGK